MSVHAAYARPHDASLPLFPNIPGLPTPAARETQTLSLMVSLFSGVAGFELGMEPYGHEVTLFCEIDPCAQAVLRSWKPHVRLEQDVRLLDELPADGRLLCAGFPCFPAGTFVTTDAGQESIESLAVGRRVLTHEGRYRPITRTYVTPDAPLVEVRVQGAPPIRCTPDHPFYARRPIRNEIHNRVAFTEPEWVPAHALTPDHLVALPMDTETVAGRSWESPAFWYLVGRYLGDGWLVEYARRGRKNSVCRKVLVCTSHDDADVLAGKIADAGYHATRSPERTVTKFHISSSALVEFLRPFGRYCEGKRLPEWVFSAPREVLAALWQGYVDADGSVNELNTRATTASRALAIGMARVARLVTGRASSVYAFARRPGAIEGRRHGAQRGYEVRVQHGPNLQAVCDARHMWAPVRRVAALDERTTVFNIEVEEDHTYVAEGVVVHNCTDLAKAGEKRGIFGPQSGLVRDIFRLLAKRRVETIVIENVVDLLSLASGIGIEYITSQLEALGYRWAYRCLNSAAFGVPQRRRRVYIVACQHGDPREILLVDNAPENSPVRAADVDIDAHAVGFYWSEGRGGLGLALDHVPPLKASNTPPAILFPDGRLVTPNIRDAERLQAMPVDWTRPGEVGGASGRWRLCGNAVTRTVPQWIAGRMEHPLPYAAGATDQRFTPGRDRWPKAAWNMGDGPRAARVSENPCGMARPAIGDFLQFAAKPLSARATAGFLGRARESRLNFPPGFLERVDAHLQRQRDIEQPQRELLLAA